MDETAFWALIDRARGSSAPFVPSADAGRLQEVLIPLSDREVREFGTEFARQIIRLNDWSVWAAGYVMNGGLSDDGFEYFRSWLVGRGKQAVETALLDAERFIDFIAAHEGDEGFENEELGYVASEILQSRGLDAVPWHALDGFGSPPRGKPFDEETVEKRFPRLAAHFA